MRKTYQMFLALLLMAVGAMNVSAEEISLQEVPFCTWDGWTLDASSTGEAECAWVVGEASGLPYGDSNVINYADLTNCTKLTVIVTDGTPRFLFNRDVDEGQWNENESESHLIDNTRGGWSSKYFTSQAGEEEGETVYIVDLKQMVKDKGYAHLHAIKGANWAEVTVLSMTVETTGKKKTVGWIDLINNGSMEGDDVSSFAVAEDAVNVQGVQEATIQDGVGVNGSRALVVNSLAGATEDWATQLFVKLGQTLLEGTKWRFSMDVKADHGVDGIGSGSHGAPRDYLGGGIIPAFNVTEDWTTVTAEGTIAADLADKLASIAFDLNKDRETANTFYFDNIKFEVYKAGTSAMFSNDVVLLDFGFDTNLPELVKQSGARRLFFEGCATVKANGAEKKIASIEGLDDGRFYIFLEDALNANAQVEVTFTNSIGLIYTSGANQGTAVANFSGIADYDESIEENEGYPYSYVTPTVMVADPEDGSFNLPNNVNFTITFDKVVDCAALVATANGAAMTVSPASGFAKEVTLSAGSLSDGECTVKVTKIYPETRLDDSIFGEYEFTVSIGETVNDPNDQPKDLIPAEYFANCAAGNIPEGFFVKFGEEERPGGTSYGGGSRMFDFAAGGDFTKGLYFREGYVEYGTTPGYELALEAGKKYTISFNSAMWKSSGTTLDLKVLDEGEEEKFSQTINNTPDVNGNQGAVSGSTKSSISFIPETSGNYIVRWVADGWKEVLLANVAMKYMPNKAGIEYIMMLDEALAAAKAALEGNSDERYLGQAYDNLNSTIAKYDGAKFTSPSAYNNAVAELNAAVEALGTHRANCDSYDTQIKKAIDVVRQNASNKFAKTALYQQLVSIVGKYNGTSEWENIGDEENEQWQLNYSFDLLKDDAQLSTAIEELKDIANTTSLLFTEGVSAPEDANGGKGTGVAVLIERLRLGAEDLTALGGDDDPLIEVAKNALTDEDIYADALKTAIKQHLYSQLAQGANLFEPVVDEETLEETTPTYDMTVFVKNPNTYKLSDGVDFTDESVPGWTTPDGYNRPGLTPGWGAWKGNSEIAQDAMFQTWGSSYRVEQTIYDLPAGVYSVRFAFGERNNGDDGVFADSYAYVVTSDFNETQSPYRGDSEKGEEMYIPGIGQAFPFAGNDNQAAVIDDIEVTDGELTIGVNAGPSSHTFFNEVRIVLTAPAAGFDYAKAAQDGIETLEATPNKVRTIELFDLNGRRISQARQGVVLMKKTMTDGTVSTEKVVKK
jgi:hypothetical protein